MEWHEQGRKLLKQNSINDFISATQYVIDEEISNPDLIAAEGFSAGGTVVAAAVNQRPDLYSVVMLKVVV